jgi:hypothetical protein
MESPCRKHSHPSIKRGVTREQVRRELADLYHQAGYVGPVDLAWTDELRQTHNRNTRRYAQVMPFLEVPHFEFAPQMTYLPRANRRALEAHEIGHVLDPYADEDGADEAARRALGIRIRYDRRWPGKGLQTTRDNPAGTRVICAWCKRVLREAPPGAPVSHGICEDCLEEQRRGIPERRNPSTGERAREAHRRWNAHKDEEAFQEWLGLRERLGLPREPREFSSWEEIDRETASPTVLRSLAVQEARPSHRRKRMRVTEAEDVIVTWLRERGWRPDSAARGYRAVYISPDQKQRVTFKRTNVIFEVGSRGNWSRNYQIHDWGNPLGTIDFAERLLRNTRVRLARHVTDPYAPNPELPAPRDDPRFLPARIQARGEPPRRHSFELMAQGEAPLVYIPHGAITTRLPEITSALGAILSRHPEEGGLATPDAWENLAAAVGVSAAKLYVVDRNGERWRVLRVNWDPGGYTGEIEVQHQGRHSRGGRTHWLDLQQFYGQMLPVVIFKGRRR